jgi:ABC-type polysaccharide/polyol phosphate export permease
MFSGDRIWAFGAVAVLWSVYSFVFWKLSANPGAESVLIALAISGGLVLLFCTASIIAMINHYAEDKEHIYGLDIHYLDEMKKARG